MSSLGEASGQFFDLFSGKGKYGLLDLVKNKDIQSSINDMIANYKQTSRDDSTDLNAYISDYLSGNDKARKDATQEEASVDRFFNGDVTRQLDELEAQQSNLGNQAVSRALDYQRQNLNRSLVNGGAGADSSYQNRAAVGSATNLNLGNALQNLSTRRGDVMYENDTPLSLIGRRASIRDALASRDLVPSAARQANLGWNAQMLNQIENDNSQNNMYAAQYNPSWGEQVGTHIADLVQAAAEAYAMYEGNPGPAASDHRSTMNDGSGAQFSQSPSSPSPGQWDAMSAGYGPVTSNSMVANRSPYAPSSPSGDGGWSSSPTFDEDMYYQKLLNGGQGYGISGSSLGMGGSGMGGMGGGMGGMMGGMGGMF